MHNRYDISSILNAVDEINLKKKKKNINFVTSQNSIPKLNHDLKISSDLDKLIQEAEEYKNKSSHKSQEVSLINKKNYQLKQKNNIDFVDIEDQIIEDLYSRLKKKVKKNTLKIIFDLHLKIKNLENRLENTKDNKKQELKKNKNFSNLNNRDILKEDVVTSLKIQDSSIAILNEKIINFKKSEEKLLLQVIDLEQDKTILSKQVQKFKEFNNYKNVLHTTKKTLKSIYDQVMKQKKIFQELKNYSIKIERESKVYKENYEKLVIENNDIKLRLTISKEQNITYQKNKLDLLSSINHLNEILSKTNIVKNISSQETSSEKKILKLEKKFEINE